MKKIWIVNYYTNPPEFVSNPRHLEFARNLTAAGFEVSIFSSGFLRGKNINLVPKGKKYYQINKDGYHFIHIKSRHYKGNGIARMFSIIQFAFRILLFRNNFEKPDYILHNVHVPFDYPILWCARMLKAQYIAEVWDLWPDAFVRMGLVKKNNLLVKLAFKIEKWIYEKADKIIFSFEGGMQYLTERKLLLSQGGKVDPKKIFYINNGVNLEEFNRNKESFKIQDKDLEDDDYFKVVYLGSVRMVNNVKQLIDAAAILKDKKNIRFLIYGDGDDRPYLEEYCKINSINNVIFKDKWIPLKNVPYVLSRSSLNILNYKKDFGTYGASSGKLFLYLASGKPICCNVEMNYCLLKKHLLGIAREFNDSQEYAEAILSLQEMDPKSRMSMHERLLSVVEDFDYKRLSAKLISAIVEN